MGDEFKKEIDEVRSLGLASDARDAAIVEWKGKKFEVLAPTLAQVRKIRRLAREKDGTLDDFKLTVHAVIELTVLPGTEQKIFTPADQDALLNKRTGKGTFLGALAKAIGAQMQQPTDEDAEALEKNSEATAGASSSLS